MRKKTKKVLNTIIPWFIYDIKFYHLEDENESIEEEDKQQTPRNEEPDFKSIEDDQNDQFNSHSKSILFILYII